MDTRTALLAVGLTLWTGLAGAAGNPQPELPDWVLRGSGAFIENDREVFLGLGIVQSVRDRTFAWAVSDLRACDEVGQTLNGYISLLGKAYESSTRGRKATEEGLTTKALKSFAKFSLKGPVITSRFQDPADGTQFSLCRLDLSSIKASTLDNEELDAGLRQFAAANAERVFAQLTGQDARAATATREGASAKAAWQGPLGAVTAVAFSPDGTKVLCSDGEKVSLWDAAGGPPLWSREGAADFLAFSENGRTAAAAAYNGLIHGWDAQSGESRPPLLNRVELQVLNRDYVDERHSRTKEMVVSRTAKHAVLGLSTDELAQELGLSSRAEQKDYMESTASEGRRSSEIQHISLSSTMTFTLPGSRLRAERSITASSDNGGGSQTQERVLVSHDVVSPDGRSGLRYDTDGALSLYDPASLTDVWSLNVPGLKAAALSPDGRAALSGTSRNSLALWDAASGEVLGSWSLSAPITALAFSPDGRTALVGLGASREKLRVLHFPAGADGRPVYGKTATVKTFRTR